MNLLIPYVVSLYHNDPLLEEFTYGDVGARAQKMKKDLKRGDYVFFHTNIRGRKYITAYYVVDRVLYLSEVMADRNLTAKYNNPHIREYRAGKRDDAGEVVLFGDPITSRALEKPLPFDRNLVEKLSLGIEFVPNRSETECIGSATRAWRELSNADIDFILEAMKTSGEETVISRILSADEVAEAIEKDIHILIRDNSNLIGKSLKLIRSEYDTPVGRIDLLFEDEKTNFLVVELKLNKIGRKAIDQLRRYMDWLRTESKKEVRGTVLCEGVMPAFEEDLSKLKDNIEILCYGWQLTIYPWRKDLQMHSQSQE